MKITKFLTIRLLTILIVIYSCSDDNNETPPAPEVERDWILSEIFQSGDDFTLGIEGREFSYDNEGRIKTISIGQFSNFSIDYNSGNTIVSGTTNSNTDNNTRFYIKLDGNKRAEYILYREEVFGETGQRNTLADSTVYVYDANGYVIETRRYQDTRVVNKKTAIIENGNITKIVEEITQNSDVPIITTYTYTYSDQPHLALVEVAHLMPYEILSPKIPIYNLNPEYFGSSSRNNVKSVKIEHPYHDWRDYIQMDYTKSFNENQLLEYVEMQGTRISDEGGQVKETNRMVFIYEEK